MAEEINRHREERKRSQDIIRKIDRTREHSIEATREVTEAEKHVMIAEKKRLQTEKARQKTEEKIKETVESIAGTPGGVREKKPPEPKER